MLYPLTPANLNKMSERSPRFPPRASLLFLKAALLILLFIPALSQPAHAEDKTASKTASSTATSTTRLTYEEYVTFAEQAIRSLSAQVDNISTQNNLLKAQLKGVQDAITAKSADSAEQLGQRFSETQKDLLGKHPGCTSIVVNGELNCTPENASAK